MSNDRICRACGTAYPDEIPRPDVCIICADDRQYIPAGGQKWTSEAAIADEFKVARRQVADSIVELRIEPLFAIGQRALVVISPSGNILWDCVPLLDDETVGFIKSIGGLRAIAFSHPHFYSNMKRWSQVFGCPVYIHRADSEWIVDAGSHIELWSGAGKELWDGMTLIQVGGHFPGSAILRSPSHSPHGTLFCGDTFVISPSRKHVAAQYSYPNRMPLPVAETARIKEFIGGIEFDTLLGWNSTQEIFGDAADIVDESLSRYV